MSHANYYTCRKNKMAIKYHLNNFALKGKNFYHKEVKNLYQFLIPPKKNILAIGKNSKYFLFYLKPNYYKYFESVKDLRNLKEKFDFIILPDVLSGLEDIQEFLENLRKISDERTRIIITSNNYLWEPILILAEKLGLKKRQPAQNWLSQKDIENLIELTGLNVIKKSTYLLLPLPIPYVSFIANKYLARLPIIKHLCLIQYFVIRIKPYISPKKQYSVSVVIPAKNEEGNIEQLVKRIPKLGNHTDIIFVAGKSTDKTSTEIKRISNKYKNKNITIINQKNGTGKADAVRKGFAKAKGDILMILDADLSVDPEDLLKFYNALKDRKGEYIQGSRLVYQMEKQSMRFLNILGNKFFSIAFSWLLDQPIKDTLCGTKVLFRKDYENLVKNRSFFGDFDPFGDFDLIFGTTKLNLKMLEIPVRYRARTYGKSNISRFSHGWLLLKMTMIAARKIKFF